MIQSSKRFVLPTKLFFGTGSLNSLKDFVSSSDRVVIITDPGLLKIGLHEKVVKLLEEKEVSYCIFSEIEVNPHAKTVQSAVDFAKSNKANVVVTIGGGSPIDVAKMVAVLLTNEGTLEDYQWNNKAIKNTPATLIAISTTAGTGTEVTKTSVIIDRNTKKGINNDGLFPKVSIVDPELMLSLPPQLTATTGMDALTHAIEAYLGLNANPVTDALALEAIKILGEYLPKAYANGMNLEAREKLGIASSLAGIAMDQSGLGFVHAMSGPLGSYYNVAHGLSNAVLLPYGMRFNLIAVLEKMGKIAAALGIDTTGMTTREKAEAAIYAVEGLCADLEIPTDLAEYNGKKEDIEKFAEEAMNMFLMRNNPRKPNKKDCIAVYERILVK